MKKNILPINQTPSITSYLHHSYTNAIIESDNLICLYIDSIGNYDWIVEKNDIYFNINKELNALILIDKPNRESKSFYMKRICKVKDEIIVFIENIKIIDALTYVQLSFGGKNELLEDYSFYMKWNQYNININEDIINRDLHQYSYYKMEKSGNLLLASISLDNENWELLCKRELAIDDKEDLYFHIHIYYGNNQYQPWKYMNYMQLFYNENDYNTVYLDYYMFPRKGFDASYNYMCHFLDTEYVNIEDYLNIYKNNEHYIKHSIDHEYYVNIALDEYYIQNRGASGKHHDGHFNLFYGYDDTRQEFLILGYNEYGKIVSTGVLYDDLENAICSKNFVRYKYNPNQTKMNFCIEYVIQLLKEYVFGLDTSVRMTNILKATEGCYGMKIFDKLRFTERGKYLLINDRRVSYILYEHCVIMKDRLTYMVKNGHICVVAKNDLISLCNDMLNASGILKNLVIKHHFLENKENNILECLDSLYDLQVRFYTLLLDNINTGQ